MHPLELVQPGDVLICRLPQPRLSQLLANAGALVLESGGALSNAATLAREYGIPVVIASGATALIRDGQQVSVDGDRGYLQVLA